MDAIAVQRQQHLARVKAMILINLPCSVSVYEALAAGRRAGFGDRYSRTGLWELIVERKVRLSSNNRLSIGDSDGS